MFAAFLRNLLNPAPSVAPMDGPLALCALLVRIARADGAYAEAEIGRIDRAMASLYGLSPFEAAALRTRAEALEAEAPDTVRFTRAIKEAVPHPDRLSLVQALWSVALADGRRDAEEDALIRLAVDLLGIRDTESALARSRAEGRS